MLPSRSQLHTNHFGTDCSACCRRGPYISHQPLRNRLLSMLPSRSLYFPPTTSEPTAQHVAVTVPIAVAVPIFPTNHFGTDCSACCPRGPYFPPTTSEPTAQHVAVAVPTPTNHFGIDSTACCRRGPDSYQPLRDRLLSMLPSRSLLPTNHFGTDCSACCRRGHYSSNQPLRNRLLGMLPSRSLLPTNHFGTDCSACCRRGLYFPPTTSEPTAQHGAVAVSTSHQPLRNRLLSMLPSRSLLPTNHFGTECSACCPRGPYFPPTTSEPNAQHVALAVPTSHQPLRIRLLSMLPSWSLLPTNHFGTDCSACCIRGHYSSHQPLRNRLLRMLPSRSLLPTNHFGTDCSACCRRASYQPLRNRLLNMLPGRTAQHVALAVPNSHQPLRNRLLCMLPSRSRLPPTTSSRSLFHTNHFGDRLLCR